MKDRARALGLPFLLATVLATLLLTLYLARPEVFPDVTSVVPRP